VAVNPHRLAIDAVNNRSGGNISETTWLHVTV
jgi:hypothetical protein